MFRSTVSVILFLCSLSATAANVVKETIVFLQENGFQHLTYTTARTDQNSYSLYLDKDDRLKEYLYLYPNDYRFDEQSDEQANLLHFRQGDYAVMTPGNFSDQVRVGSNGIYRFSSWDGVKRPDGHFGFWNRPDDFSQFVYVWVLPANFEFIDYRANREGEWVQRHNTLAWYGKQVNDLTFDIEYRLRSHATFEAIKTSLKEQVDVQVEQQQQGIKVTLLETLLFPSGSSDLSASGKRLIQNLVSGLKKRPGVKIIVNGHTDNIPIKSPLKRRYKTNWELAAARAMAVVHRMQELGMVGEFLEARAYGPYRPAATNKTAKGRAANRRIELEIIEPEA